LMQEHPERIITFAVDGMLPHNHLHDKMMKRLKVYAGPTPAKKVVEKPVERVETKTKKSVIRNIPAELKGGQKKQAKR
jgi:ribosomal protein L13